MTGELIAKPKYTPAQEQVLAKTKQFLQEKHGEECTGHDWYHIERVWRNACRIAESEAVDTFIVELAALLHDIASAIERRGKAIRYHGRLECSRAVEAPLERLNVDYDGLLSTHVRVSIWSDGQLWLCVTQPGPRRTGGWELYDEFRSHVAEFDGADVSQRFEQTIHSPTRARDFWPHVFT